MLGNKKIPPGIWLPRGFVIFSRPTRRDISSQVGVISNGRRRPNPLRFVANPIAAFILLSANAVSMLSSAWSFSAFLPARPALRCPTCNFKRLRYVGQESTA
jgi:hypothetical protein